LKQLQRLLSTLGDQEYWITLHHLSQEDVQHLLVIINDPGEPYDLVHLAPIVDAQRHPQAVLAPSRTRVVRCMEPIPSDEAHTRNVPVELRPREWARLLQHQALASIGIEFCHLVLENRPTTVTLPVTATSPVTSALPAAATPPATATLIDLTDGQTAITDMTEAEAPTEVKDTSRNTIYLTKPLSRNESGTLPSAV
jgi:hypothetical protein